MYGCQFFVLLVFIYGANSVNIQSLNAEWKFVNSNNSIQGIGDVPGGIYTDLMTNGILDDIFSGFNDIKYRWVGLETWTYFRSFDITEEFLRNQQINIVFEGLDTYSNISINNVTIGFSNNMFVRYTFDIKTLLKAGQNDIKVSFASPIAKASEEYSAQALDYTVPPFCVPDEYRGECHVNHIRKMQASFSWDWGPAFPSVGIWKNVYLEGFDVGVIRDLTVEISRGPSDWIVNTKTYIDSNLDRVVGTLVSSMETNSQIVQSIVDVDKTSDENEEFIVEDNFLVPFDSVDQWWPNGFGEQRLYNLEITLFAGTGDEVKNYKIGFRTIELVQQPLENGLTFYFKVNDIPIFMKGTNSIPINILPELGQNETTIRFLLQSAKDVHMNMIRVWGGGVYESDTFYRIADELGILIWEDFMFACSMYPTNENFLRNVIEEVKHQVRRLQHHASVAIWAGNNENEAALRDNWYGTGNNFTLYKTDYVTLYIDTIKKVVLENDKSRPFLTSSPTNGLKSEEEGHVAEHPYDSHYGDIHYYNYISSSWDQSVYPMTRFASEYGFQSLPRLQTLKLATNRSEDLIKNSEFLMHRQHHKFGYEEMDRMIAYQFHLPENDINYMENYIFYNQINQAMSVKVETEHYRQWRSMLDSDGRGNTMGALYWQLNDVWVAPTWAGIDFDNRWKMLHYFAKKFFAPVLVSANLSVNRQLTIFSISDELESIHNVSLNIEVFKWDSFVPVWTEKQRVDILAESSMPLMDVWIDDYLSEKGCGIISVASDYCIMHLSFLDPNTGDLIGVDNFVIPTHISSTIGMKTPTITVKINQNFSTKEGTSFIIQVMTDNITLFVWLDTGDIRGQFTENGFHMIASEKFVGFKTEQPTTPENLQSSLSIKSYVP